MANNAPPTLDCLRYSSNGVDNGRT
jgi:hypothetical protein